MTTALATTIPGFATDDGLARCTVCSTELPLRKSMLREQPVQWECARCGARLTGVINENAPGDYRFNVFPTQVHFSCDAFEQSPARIDEFVRKMTPRADGAEKRSSPRMPLCLAAAAMPLDENRDTKGVAFMVLLHNISAGGIAFSHMQPITEPYVALELWAQGDQRMKVMVKILRRRAVGQFYEIAGEFVTD